MPFPRENNPTLRYRKVSDRGQVDETLFGQSSNANQIFQEDIALAKYGQRKAPPTILRKVGSIAPVDKPKTKIVTSDLIRDLIIPESHGKLNEHSVLLSGNGWNNIKTRAKVTSKEEMDAQFAAKKQETDRQREEAHDRKELMRQKDLDKVHDQRKHDPLLDEVAREKIDLLERANEQRLEEEDEIKQLNEMITKVKCHAIRDTQMAEKQQIRLEMDEEERRLDAMMEYERLNQMAQHEEQEKIKTLSRRERAKEILEQIQGNWEERILAKERKEQEAEQARKHFDKLLLEDVQKLMKKRDQQRQMADDFDKENRAILERRERFKEQEAMAELKVLEYMKQRAEREKEFEDQQARLKKEKELEISRIRAQQEKAIDTQAERDALVARRRQEEAEREWRRQEKEEAEKKSKTMHMLRKAREDQVAQKEHFLAVQAQRDRSEFERMLRAQLQAQEKDEDDDEKREQLVRGNADALRKQIQALEEIRIKERQKFFEEGFKNEEQENMRQARYEALKQKKIQELRDMGIPEKYLSEINRKAKFQTKQPLDAVSNQRQK